MIRREYEEMVQENGIMEVTGTATTITTVTVQIPSSTVVRFQAPNRTFIVQPESMTVNYQPLVVSMVSKTITSSP